MNKTSYALQAGDAVVASLAKHGVEYFFGNAGTDFAPLIEAFSRAAAEGMPSPLPVTVPHENTAMGMAYGYYLATGRPQAVMTHVTVGTANATLGVMNAERQNVPILLMAGRTPISEGNARGARSRHIHWAQESFDQAAMLREYTKWDYELRRPEMADDVIGRGLSIAMTEPRGPVYLTLPREVIATELPGGKIPNGPVYKAATAPAPDPAAIEQVAKLIAKAKRPVIITTNLGANHDAVAALDVLADECAITVAANWPRYVNIRADHPMYLGVDSKLALEGADVIIVIECDVPWTPSTDNPGPDVAVIHIGADPLFSNYPIRTFPTDLAITSDPAAALREIHRALGPLLAGQADKIDARHREVRARHDAYIAGVAEELKNRSAEKPMSRAFVTAAIEKIRGTDGILLNESPVSQGHLTHTRPGTYFSSSAVGGLGWALGASLGIKLADRSRFIMTAVGDGSYMFNNPTSAHQMSRAMELPTLTIIFNNLMWGAVSRATKAMYPGGYASRSNRVPLTHLDPAPDYEVVVTASGGYGAKVEEPDDLMPALEKARDVVINKKRPAVLNVMTEGV